MLRNVIRRVRYVCTLGSALFTVCAFTQPLPHFDITGLAKLGDSVRYGSYVIYRIGDGIYQINDPGDKVNTRMGGWGADMYLICGTEKAFMVDLGNNYIDGYKPDLIKPRKNAAEELQAVVFGLTGKLPLEIAITHAHPDHVGMTGAFINNKNVIFWMPEGENSSAFKTQFNIDPSVYSRFVQGKSFDLGGGRVVTTYLLRGHTNGSTAYLLKKDTMLFTGDALGSGFGQSFGRLEAIKGIAEDSQKLVEAIKANLAPYERYALKVYTGHTWQNVYGGFVTPDEDTIDVGYLDWRFVQNAAACANGILKGKWLVDGSGLRYVPKMAQPAVWGGRAPGVLMVYGTAAIFLPLKTAYEAAGLPMPEEAQQK